MDKKTRNALIDLARAAGRYFGVYIGEIFRLRGKPLMRVAKKKRAG